MGTLETQFAETRNLNKELIMAARENAEFNVDKSLNRTETLVQTNMNKSKSSARKLSLRSSDRNNQVLKMSNDSSVAKQKRSFKKKSHGVAHHHHQMSGGDYSRMNNEHDDDGGEGFKKEMRDLEERLSKLNPMAQDFVPPLVANSNKPVLQNSAPHFAYIAAGENSVRQKIGSSHGKRRANSRTSMTQRDYAIRRTVYVSDIDDQVTEEQLVALFISCGQIVDCRVCGDPNTVRRFAFVEFTDEEGARNALSLAGKMLGLYPVRVLPSTTAIAPVNPKLLPRSEDEREKCTRTIYCTNIDKKVIQEDIKLFFESFCGEVLRLRLLGDCHHSTCIAFLEFATAESAIAALKCSGVVLGTLPIRVSPSKTPIRQGVIRNSLSLLGRSSETILC